MPEKNEEISDYELMMKIINYSKGNSIGVDEIVKIFSKETLTRENVQTCLENLVERGFLQKNAEDNYEVLIEKEEYFPQKLRGLLENEGYKVLERLETTAKTQTVEDTHVVEDVNFHFGFFSLTSLFLIFLGVILLAWVVWITWYDITTWNKNLTLIFFGSRKGEFMSLGIGMILIYYFIMSLALVFSGSTIFLLKRFQGFPFRKGKDSSFQL